MTGEKDTGSTSTEAPPPQVTCPSCGAINRPEATFCISCRRGLTLSGRLAQPWGRSGCASRLSCTWVALTGLGCLALFIFPPLGAFILIASLWAQYLLKKSVAGPCPYCRQDTATSMGTAHGTVFQCIHCGNTLFIDRSSGAPVFVTNRPDSLSATAATAAGQTPSPGSPAPGGGSRGRTRRLRVLVPAAVVIALAYLYFSTRGTSPDRQAPAPSPSRQVRTRTGSGSSPPTGGARAAAVKRNAEVPPVKASGGNAGSAATAPAKVPGKERILSFHSDIAVLPDSSLEVRETIRVRARGIKIKRGIYRDFPTRYPGRFGDRVTVGFRLLGVTRGGKKEPFHSTNISNGVRIYIGDRNVFLDPGEYTYTISYRTTDQLGYFEDYDELYWNVTGVGWDFPIDSASAEIHLPEGASILDHAGYTGPAGSAGADYSAEFPGGGRARFSTTRPLGRHEGLTVAVSWPKGIVAEPALEDRARRLVKSNLPSAAALAGFALVMLYYLVVWLEVGRDPKAGPIVPMFGPPEGFSPAAVRYVMKMGYSDRVFASAIVNMAVKGYLTIEEQKGTFTLKRAAAGESALTAGERKIAGKLFGGGRSIELKQRNHARIGGAVKMLKQSLKADFETLHFARNSSFLAPGVILTALTLAAVAFTAPDRGDVFGMTLWLSLWTVGTFGIVMRVSRAWRTALSTGRGEGMASGVAAGAAVFLTLFALPFVIPQVIVFGMFARKVSPVAAAVLALLIATNLLYYWLLKAPTLQGRKVMDQIEGFRIFLEAAEQDRLERLNPPEKTPRLFEKFLPYALALGVENAWAEKFAGVLSGATGAQGGYRPVWYSGGSLHGFSPGALAASLGTSLSATVASSSRAPGSSSGSGGGGSSGGGGGGGGGGGW